MGILFRCSMVEWAMKFEMTPVPPPSLQARQERIE
jgi:hypothetical protein